MSEAGAERDGFARKVFMATLVAAVLGIQVVGVFLMDLLPVAANFELLTVFLFAAVPILLTIVLPRIVGSNCRMARLLQALCLTLPFAGVPAGPCSAVFPLWLLLSGQPPRPWSLALLAGGLFFLVCYGFLACVHAVWSKPWRCCHYVAAV